MRLASAQRWRTLAIVALILLGPRTRRVPHPCYIRYRTFITRASAELANLDSEFGRGPGFDPGASRSRTVNPLRSALGGLVAGCHRGGGSRPPSRCPRAREW